MDVLKRGKKVCEQVVDWLGVSGADGKQVFEVGLAGMQRSAEQSAKRGCVGLNFDIGRVMFGDDTRVVYVQDSTMIGRR